jgi:hypothetical protein
MWLFHNITTDASWEDLCTISSYLIEWRLLPSLDPFLAGQSQTCPFLACLDCIGSYVICGCLTADIGCVCLLNVFEHPWHVFYPCHGRYSIGVLPENPRTSKKTGTLKFFWCCVLVFIFYNQESCIVRRLCREEEAKVQEGKIREHCKSKQQNNNRYSNWKVRAPKLCCYVSNFLGAAFLRPRKLLLNFIYLLTYLFIGVSRFIREYMHEALQIILFCFCHWEWPFNNVPAHFMTFCDSGIY